MLQQTTILIDHNYTMSEKGPVSYIKYDWIWGNKLYYAFSMGLWGSSDYLYVIIYGHWN